MSIRMAMAKLAAAAVGGAMLGGGAVHVSEAPSTGEIHHVKPIKVKQAKAPRVHHARRVAPRQPTRARRIVRTVTTKSCEAAAPQQLAMVPMPYLPAPQMPSGGGSTPVVIGGGGLGGFGGGFFGGFFGGGGSGGGNVVISSTTTGSTSSSSSGGSSSTSS